MFAFAGKVAGGSSRPDTYGPFRPRAPRIRQLDSSANVPRRYFVEESICWPKLSNFALFCP